MNVLRAALYFFAGVFVLVPLAVIGLFHMNAITIGLLAVGVVLAYLTARQARTFNVQQSENQKAQLEQTYRQLAEKNAGVVSISQLVNATGEPKEQVQHNMRALVGKGLCELDFSANGEMQYKYTPLDGPRAELAQFREK